MIYEVLLWLCFGFVPSLFMFYDYRTREKDILTKHIFFFLFVFVMGPISCSLYITLMIIIHWNRPLIKGNKSNQDQDQDDYLDDGYLGAD